MLKYQVQLKALDWVLDQETVSTDTFWQVQTSNKTFHATFLWFDIFFFKWSKQAFMRLQGCHYTEEQAWVQIWKKRKTYFEYKPLKFIMKY